VDVTASNGDSIVALLSNWLDQEWEARFLLDDRLKVLWHNRTANDWLDRPQCPLKLTAEVLATKDSRSQGRFASLFSGANVTVRTLLVADTAHGADMLFHARHVGEFGGASYFGLCVRSTCASQTHDLIGLGEAFSLTPSEEAVLKKMVRGNTVDRIARSSKTSPETVRTHVRRAYSKMSVSSREEMFSRIRPFLFGR
jgi:DNA-binding CsgD family transcriptional regulator